MNKKNTKAKINIKQTLSSLLMNNRFLVVCSFVIAFALWLWVAIEQSPIITHVIEDVPVKIQYENSVPQNQGLQIFGKDDYTVDITVTGKKYIVSSLKADDFDVIAKTDTVVSSGKADLKVYAVAKDTNTDFTISDYSDSSIEVFFDKPHEQEFFINVTISSILKEIVPENHKLGTPIPSKSKVVISGPTTVLENIKSVDANINVDSVLRNRKSFNTHLTINAKDSSVIDETMLKIDGEDFNDTSSTISVTLPVLKIVTLPTILEFKNAPAELINNTLPFQINPAKVQAAVPVEEVDRIDHYVVKVIDFADIYNIKNVYKVPVEESESYDIFDVDSGNNIESFTVTVDASQMATKTVAVPSSNISIKNNNSDYDISIVSQTSKTVTIVGDVNAINNVVGDDVMIVVDVANQTVSEDTKALKGNVIITISNKCWAVGECNVSVVVK